MKKFKIKDAMLFTDDSGMHLHAEEDCVNSNMKDKRDVIRYQLPYGCAVKMRGEIVWRITKEEACQPFFFPKMPTTSNRPSGSLQSPLQEDCTVDGSVCGIIRFVEQDSRIGISHIVNWNIPGPCAIVFPSVQVLDLY